MRALALAVAFALVAGCARDDGTRSVDAPAGGAWAECPPAASRGIAVPFRASAIDDAPHMPPGIHRLDARSFLWVWAAYNGSLREDRITRVNAVDVARDAEGLVHVCTRVDVSTPTAVDAEPRTYVVAARLEAQETLPEGPVRVVVNWVAGCPCSPLPKGNASARFE